jgi:WD40 repeat protein
MKRLILLCILSIFILPSVTAQDESPIVEIARLGRGTINTMAWRPDGSMFVVGSGDGLWFYNESLETLVHIGSGYISLTKWSPDGNWLVVNNTYNGECHTQILRFDDLEVTATHEYDECFRNADWHPDSLLLAYVLDATIYIVDVTTQQIQQEISFTDEAPNYPLSIKWSNDGTKIAIVQHLVLSVWDVETSEIINSIVREDYQWLGFADFIVWSEDDSHVETQCSEAKDGDVWIEQYTCEWNITTGELVNTVDLGGSYFFRLGQIARTSDNVLFYTIEKQIPYEDLIRSTSTENPFVEHGHVFVHHPTELKIAYATQDGVITIYDRRTEQEITSASLHMPVFNDIAWHPSDGRLAVSGYGWYSDIRIWQMNENQQFTDEPIARIGREIAETVTWSDDGSEIYLYADNQGDTVFVWDEATLDGETYEWIDGGVGQNQFETLPYIVRNHAGTMEASYEYPNDIELGNHTLDFQGIYFTDMLWTPDDSQFITISQDYDNNIVYVEFWNPTTGERTRVESFENTVHMGTMQPWKWQPNGEYLAIELIAREGNTTIEFINIASDENLPTIELDTGNNLEFVWSPDSQFIAVGNGVQIYEVATGELVASESVYGNVALDWSQDGQYIAAGGGDGIVRIFDVSRIVSNN